MRDPRERNDAHHATTTQTRQIDWASPQQQEAFEYGPYPLCASGGFGASKTWALCLKVLWLCSVFPNNRFVIARKIGKELRLTTMATFFKICPAQAYAERDGGRRSDTEHILRLGKSYGHSEILWMHLEDEDVMGVVRGLEINGFLLDQAEEISEEVFDVLSSRLGRWDKTVVPPQTVEMFGHTEESWPWKDPTGRLLPPTYAMIACNPDTEMHWIYRRFHKDSPDWREKYSKQGYRMITMSSFDNKFLPKQNRDQLAVMDESFKRRFVYGEWGIPEGQIHDIPKEAIIPGTPQIVEYIKQRSRLGRSLDHGDFSPTCCLWWAVDRDGNLFFFREYYRGNVLIADHRKEITLLSKGEKYDLSVADPSMFSETQQKNDRRVSFADDYLDRNPSHGFNPDDAIAWSKADNNEFGTRLLLNQMLRLQGTGEIDPETGKEKPRVHPLRNKMGYWPRVFFIEKSESWPYGCDQSIRQTRSQRREKTGTEMGKPIFSDERDESITDHAYDAVRYAVATKLAAPKEPGRTAGAKTFLGVLTRHRDFMKSGGQRILAEQARRQRLLQ